LGECLGLLELLAGLDLHERHSRVCRVDRNDLRGADGDPFAPCVVDDQLRALGHLPKMLHAGRVGDAVPDRLLVALQIAECIHIRLGLQ